MSPALSAGVKGTGVCGAEEQSLALSCWWTDKETPRWEQRLVRGISEGERFSKGSTQSFSLVPHFFFLGFHPFCLPVWTSTLLIHKTGDPATAEPIASPKCHFGELQIGPCSSERLAFREEVNVSRCSWHFLIIYVCLILLCVMLSLWKSNLRALFQGKLGVSSFC